MAEIDDWLLNDTPETAPAIPIPTLQPRQERSEKAKIQAMRNSTAYKHLWKTFRAQCAKEQAYCHLCETNINYGYRYPHPYSFSLDHVIPVKENPELMLQRENCAASHLSCNQSRGTDEPPLSIGIPSEPW